MTNTEKTFGKVTSKGAEEILLTQIKQEFTTQLMQFQITLNL